MLRLMSCTAAHYDCYHLKRYVKLPHPRLLLIIGPGLEHGMRYAATVNCDLARGMDDTATMDCRLYFTAKVLPCSWAQGSTSMRLGIKCTFDVLYALLL